VSGYSGDFKMASAFEKERKKASVKALRRENAKAIDSGLVELDEAKSEEFHELDAWYAAHDYFAEQEFMRDLRRHFELDDEMIDDPRGDDIDSRELDGLSCYLPEDDHLHFPA